MEIDTETDIPLKEVPKDEPAKQPEKEQKKPSKEEKREEDRMYNCLRNVRVIVRHIPKSTGMVTNPKHILYGGMAENAKRVFTVPRLTSGMYVNVLTDAEKEYLEHVMGLEYNALSIYKKNDNFWDDSNPSGISHVTLRKQDNFLDLSDPEDYIRYKILLANKDYIAPSLDALQSNPKATYQFVIIEEGDEDRMANDHMTNTMRCYKEFGKIEDDVDKLRVVVETIDGRPTSPNVKLEYLRNKANSLIQADSKMFLKIITDPLLNEKVLLKKCVEAGFVSIRGKFYYLKEDGRPMCLDGEDPTMSMAAKYLSLPRNQELKFRLQDKLRMR